MQITKSLYKHKLLTIVSLMAVLLLLSCHKQDKQKPIIQITQPTGGSYRVGDSIRVDVSVSDNEKIKSISLYIIDESNQRITFPYQYDLNTSNYRISVKYPIDNLYIENGSYYFVVEAKDEVNAAKKYVAIQIGALPKTLEDVLIVESSGTETSIFSIKNSKQLIHTFNESYQDFIYNPYAKHYMFLNQEGQLKAFDKETFEQKWFADNLKNPIRTYLGKLDYRDNLTYVSTAHNDVRAYNNFGQLVQQFNAVDLEGQIGNYYFDDNKLMLIKTPYTQGRDKIERLNKVTGVSVKTYDMQFSPKQILFVDDELCFVLGNKNNIAKACSLSTLHNVAHPITGLGNRTFYDGFKYSTYIYVLALGNTIVEYHLPDGNERIVDYTSGSVKFFYEDIAERMYVLDQHKVSYLKYPSDGHVVVFENDKPIDDLIFVYNK